MSRTLNFRLLTLNLRMSASSTTCLDRPLCQQLNQLNIGWWEAKPREIIARCPLQLLSKLRCRPAQEIAPEKMQLDGPLRIRMRGAEDFVSYTHVDIQFFVQLPLEALRQCFAGLAFSTRKFPESFEVDALLAPCDQKESVPFDNRCADDDGVHCLGSDEKARQLFVMGQTRHLGLRATQTMAPKSIRA